MYIDAFVKERKGRESVVDKRNTYRETIFDFNSRSKIREFSLILVPLRSRLNQSYPLRFFDEISD